MPRIENLGPSVDAWYHSPANRGNGSSTWDVCITCYEELDLENGTDVVNDKLVPYNGDPPGEQRGGEVQHPCYSEDNGRCEICRARLTEEDN